MSLTPASSPPPSSSPPPAVLVDASTKPTLRTIAERAGVSRMTVSRALRRDPALPQRTCDRIRAIADEVGFRPDPKLTELMVYLRQNRVRKHTETLAFIHLFPFGRQPPSPTELRLLAGARRRAEQLGYHLEVFAMGPDDLSAKRLTQILFTRGIRGAIIQSCRGLPAEVQQLAERFGCAVLGATVPECLPLHVVRSHHAHAMQTALDQLVARGYRRVGLYVLEQTDRNVEHAWHAAFNYHRLARFGAVEPALVKLTPHWVEDDFEAWFRECRLDAVLTNHPATLDWMRAVGAKVPEDAGFVLLDWSESMSGCAGIDQNTEQLGSAAADLVVRQVHYNETGVLAFQKTLLVKGSWRDGATVRALREALPADPADFAPPIGGGGRRTRRMMLQ